VANPEGMLFATATPAISDFVLEVRFEKGKGEQGDLGLYRVAETKGGLKPGLVIRLENKSRASSVLAVSIIIFPKRWTGGTIGFRKYPAPRSSNPPPVANPVVSI